MTSLNRTIDTESTGVALLYNKDGSAQYGKDLIAADVVSAFFGQAAKHKRVIVLESPEDGITQIHNGVESLRGAVIKKDGVAAADAVRVVLHGVHDCFHVGMPFMVVPIKVPKAAGLPEAGISAFQVMTEFPNQSYNARIKVEPKDLHGRAHSLQVHLALRNVYDAASVRVTLGIGYLSNLVATGADTVNKAIADALPQNESLQKVADDLVNYFKTPLLQAQDTKKKLQKAQVKTTAKTKKDVQDQALTQARQEVRSEVEGKIQSAFGKDGSIL